MLNGRLLRTGLDVLASLTMLAASVAVIWSVAVPRAQPLSPVGASAAEDIGSASLTARLDAGTAKPGELILIEYSDFECPFCGQFAKQTLPRLREMEAAQRLKLVYRHFPLPIHKNASQAAKLAVCATEQGKFWPVHDLLFNQPELYQQSLQRQAVALSLDQPRLTSCLPSAFVAVERDVTEAKRLKVDSTPQFFIGVASSTETVSLKTRIRGAVEASVFETAVSNLEKRSS